MQHALFDGYVAKMKMQTDNKFIDQTRVKRPVSSIPPFVGRAGHDSVR